MPERKKFQAHLQQRLDEGLDDFKPFVATPARNVKELACDANVLWEHASEASDKKRISGGTTNQRPLNDIMAKLREEAEENARKKRRAKA